MSAADPELVFGLVTPVGTDTADVAADLCAQLAVYGYRTVVVKLSDALPTAPVEGETEDGRVLRLMQASRDFCARHGGAAAIARLAVRLIGEARGAATGDTAVPAQRTAYVLHSLKRPEEVRFLRHLYGPQFLLLGAQTTPEQRLDNLLRRPLSGATEEQRRATALHLVSMDAREDDPMGQHVNDTFHRADYFLGRGETARRFVRLLFGEAAEAPTLDEYAMYLARASAARSVTPSRHVGAALVLDGSVIALGSNDVPPGEQAEVVTGIDASEEYKHSLVADTIARLVAAGWRPPTGVPADEEAVIEQARAALDGSRLASVIEYQRSVHAEMAAISDAAKRGVAVRGATLHVTTYPCHLCYKSALAAEIAEVRYVEPYPKSQATAMYPASTDRLRPYDGVAPRAYMRFFGERPPVRSDARGRLAVPPPAELQPLLPDRRGFAEIHRAELATRLDGG